MQSEIQNLLAQNRLLTDEVKRRIDQLGAINTVAATVGSSLDLNVTLKTALQAVLEVMGARAGGISLVDEAKDEIVLRAQQGWPDDFTNPPMRVPLNQGMSGKVISTDDIVLDNDFDGSEPLAVPSFHQQGFRSIVMAPMHARGRIVGILSLMSTESNAFSPELVNVLRAVADTVGVALDNARLYERAAEREQQLSAIVTASADGMIATDQNGRIYLINPAAAHFFEIDAAKLIGAPLRDAPLVPRLREQLRQALLAKSDDHRAFQITLESGRDLSILVSPIHVAQQIEPGAHDGWVIVIRDVSHLRESELRRAEFMRAAAHDMKNPLGVALSALHMLRDFYAANDATAAEIIRLGLNGVTRLQALINELLRLEQFENGLGFNRSPVDVGVIANEILAEMKTVFGNKLMTTRAEIPSDLPALTGDANWIKRAVLNYVDNAVKYTPEGGRIFIRAFSQGDHVHIEVEDNGPGIPTESQSRLFERFFRVNREINPLGTGLGLAIVKPVAEAHGGTVYVRSQPGVGSTFGLTLRTNA